MAMSKKKQKGASQPLPFAQRMQLERNIEKKAAHNIGIEQAIALYYRAGGIALNRAFGFGEKRILEFQRALQEVMAEVKGEKFGADYEYAFATLDEAYRQIVKHEEEELNERQQA